MTTIPATDDPGVVAVFTALRTALLSLCLAVIPTCLLGWGRRDGLLEEVRAAGGTDAATAEAALREVLPGWLRRIRVETGARISLGLLLLLAVATGAAYRELVLVTIPLVAAAIVAALWQRDRRTVR